MTIPLDETYHLTPDQIQSFEKNGYLLLDDLLDQKSVEDVVEWTAEVKGWPNRRGEHMPYEEERADGTIGLCRTESRILLSLIPLPLPLENHIYTDALS